MRNPGKQEKGFIRWRASILLFLLLSLTGCDLGNQTLAPVRGKVTYRGMPVPTGTIVFTPDPMRGNHGQQSHASLEQDGSYVLRTGDVSGAPIGWHRVTITSTEEVPPANPNNRFVIPRCLLPDKYRDPELSGLTCEIKAGQENQIDFNLD